MILKNGLVFTEDARFVLADVEIADGKIAQVAAPGTLDGPDAVDVSGKYVTPGFVDIHIHGSKGSDFCDAGAEPHRNNVRLSRRRGRNGLLRHHDGFRRAHPHQYLQHCEALHQQRDRRRRAARHQYGGALLQQGEKGAQAEKYIVDPEIEMFDRLYEPSGGAIKLIDVAPELPVRCLSSSGPAKNAWCPLRTPRPITTRPRRPLPRAHPM